MPSHRTSTVTYKSSSANIIVGPFPSSLWSFLKASFCSILFLLFKLPLVELEFVSFKNIAIGTARLPRTRCNACQKAAALELLVNHRIHFLLRFSVLLLADDMTAALFLVFGRLFGLSFIFLDAKRDTIFFLVPLLKRLTINLNNGILQQGLRSNQFVACCIVHNV